MSTEATENMSTDAEYEKTELLPNMPNNAKLTTSNKAMQTTTDLFLNELTYGVIRTIIVMVCRVWVFHVVTGCYLSTDFVISDAKANVIHCTTKANVAHNFLKLMVFIDCRDVAVLEEDSPATQTESRDEMMEQSLQWARDKRKDMQIGNYKCSSLRLMLKMNPVTVLFRLQMWDETTKKLNSTTAKVLFDKTCEQQCFFTCRTSWDGNTLPATKSDAITEVQESPLKRLKRDDSDLEESGVGTWSGSKDNENEEY
ncbi:hypothetical protein Tco_1383325 [Tanacetum coccineum]